MNAIELRSNRLDSIYVLESPAPTPSQTPVAAPLPPVPTVSGEAASPLETLHALSSIGSGIDAALASGDPEVLMAAIASRINQSELDSARGSATAGQLTRDTHVRAQMEAYRRAQEAEQSAGVWNTIAKVGAYVGAGLAAAVGVASAAFSGGVGTVAGIALAAVLISSAATIGVQVARDSGAMREETPRWLSGLIGAVALVGAVCSLGASSASAVAVVGGAVGAASQATDLAMDAGVALQVFAEPPAWVRYITAGTSLAGAGLSIAGSVSSLSSTGRNVARTTESLERAARTARLAGEAVTAAGRIGQGAVQVVDGVATVGRSAATYQADMARADGQHERSAQQRIAMRLEDVIETMRELVRRAQRITQHASEGIAANGAASHAVISNFSRA